jgi:hypothetical protein
MFKVAPWPPIEAEMLLLLAFSHRPGTMRNLGLNLKPIDLGFLAWRNFRHARSIALARRRSYRLSRTLILLE